MPTWEEVLAAVEADAERTAALLTSATDPILSAPLALPLLAAMPPVPEQLGERIIRLRARIEELQDEFAAALSEWRAHDRPVAVRPPAVVGPAAPRFVDTRA